MEKILFSPERAPFGSVGIALSEAIRKAKEDNARELLIPEGVYHLYAEDCPAPVIRPTNHGFNGMKSTAVSICDMQDFTLDGQGSTFILHGVMDFAVIQQSERITIRNLTVTCADTCNFQGKVIRAEGDTAVIELDHPPKLELQGDLLLESFMQEYNKITRTLEYDAVTREIRTGTGDNNFGLPPEKLTKTLDGNILTVSNVKKLPVVGNIIVFANSRRCAQAFFAEKSAGIVYENITVHTCWGMAFVCQKCTDVTVRSCTVTPDEGRYWSAGQDASHFANCRGMIRVENCLFENQLDDAVNIHGIYTFLEKREGNRILIRYPHWQTRGIDIFGAGDRIQFQNQRSQEPTGTATVAAVQVLNDDKTVLTLTEIEGNCEEGQILENLSDQPDACICGNTFRNNRARGMLIASKGNIEICHTHFHTNHSAINFESDPLRWFECGSTRNVRIHDNYFDDCIQNRVMRSVIEIRERPEMPEDFYYHGTISITNNRFTQQQGACVFASSVKNLVFSGNETSCDTPVLAVHSFVNGEKIGQ